MTPEQARLRRTATARQLVSHLQRQTRQAQRTATAIVRQTRRDAVRLVHRHQRALDRLLLPGESLRRRFEATARRTSKDVEIRCAKFVRQCLDLLIRRYLEHATLSRHEVHALSHRLQALEQQLTANPHPQLRLIITATPARWRALTPPARAALTGTEGSLGRSG